MDRKWKIRVATLAALVIGAHLMLVPTAVDMSRSEAEKQANDELPLPGWFSSVFSQRLILGLDLQGGIHLQYKVDIEEALKRRASGSAGLVEMQLKKDHQLVVKAKGGDGADIDEITTLHVEFPDEASTDKIDHDFLQRFLPDYEVHTTRDTVVELTMTSAAIDSFRTEALDNAIETIERRINAFGVAESTISKRGDSELVVELPGISEKDFAAAKERLSQTGHLHFQIVAEPGDLSAFMKKVVARAPKVDAWPPELDAELQKHITYASGTTVRSTSRDIIEYMVKGQIGDDFLIGYEEVFSEKKDKTLSKIETLSEDQEKRIAKLSGQKGSIEGPIVKVHVLRYLQRKAGMTGENVTDARVGTDQFNRPEVYMTFDPKDADEFFEMTKQYTKKSMAIMIDEVVYSAPNIKEPIPGGRVRIEMGSVGATANKEAFALVGVLKSGALRAPLRKLYDSQVGPTLGADSVAAGRISIIVGFLAVVCFMLVYYSLSGIVANIALLLNLLFVMAGLTAFGATLTLPGIAGIVLTVGMAVDANVLIFERIREELHNGVAVRKAIDVGYEKAFTAIIDANITTIIAAAVLYQFGSGPIRGFAVTLAIGILCSLYTALVVTRLIFDWWYGRGPEPAKMSI